MKKGKLIFVAIAAILLLTGGGVFVSRSQVETNNDSQEVLSKQTSESGVAEKLPKLEIFTGKVEVKLPGEDFKEGQNNQEIPEGSIVKTDKSGRAQVLYPNNSVTRIDHNSEMTLENFQNSPSKTNVEIEEGRIWNRVVKLLGKDDEFSSETETLVASVRGTSYGHGIQADGNNKVSVSRSEVEVDCSIGNQPNVNVQTNKKITTKCTTGVSAINWGGEEANDEWFKWNIEQDKLLDQKYGLGIYDDLPSPTPTIKPTASPKPTVKPTASPSPTATANPNSTPTPITIDKVDVTSGRTSTLLKITGKGYSAGANPSAKLISTNQYASPSPSEYTASSVVVNNDGTMDATFSNVYLYGNYKLRVTQYSQSAEKDVTIGGNVE